MLRPLVLGLSLCLFLVGIAPYSVRADPKATPVLSDLEYISGASAQNLVENGGFEAAGAYWAWDCPSDWDATVSLDTTGKNVHRGRNSSKFTCKGIPTSNKYAGLHQSITGLTVGQTYYLEAWCKGVGVGTHEQLVTGKNWQFRANIPSGTFGWTHVKVSFTADDSSELILILMQDTTTALWVDDVSLSTESIS